MSPDSRLVATTSADKSIKLWSTENWDGKPLKTLAQVPLISLSPMIRHLILSFSF
jgi:WD40 repeat protein